MSEEQKKEPKKEPYEEIEEIKVGGQKRNVRVLKIPITWDNQPTEVWVKKLPFGERAKYTEKFINLYAKTEDVQISLAEMKIQALLMSIAKSPFPVTEDYINYELDPNMGERLYQYIKDFNQLDEAQKKN